MKNKKRKFISVIITTFNDGHYLEELISNLFEQSYEDKFCEILILEAGTNQKERLKKKFGEKFKKINYFFERKLSRTKSLNKLISLSKGELIVRLDARCKIDHSYLDNIEKLSSETDAANVGGIRCPINKNKDQELIGEVMLHPLCFGSNSSRYPTKRKEVDSIYLGAFNVKKMPTQPWFDPVHDNISEDTDLNYRVVRSGQNLIVDPNILVYYYPRESKKSFFKLCYNWGVGRGLTSIKNRKIFSFKHVLLPFSGISFMFLFLYPFDQDSIRVYLVLSFLLYIFLILIFTLNISKGHPLKIFKTTFIIMGCHLYWSSGFLFSPFYYVRNIIKFKNN